MLVYSTCSLEQEENWGQVASFLQRHAGWELQPLTVEAAEALGAPASVITPEGCMQTLPHVHSGVDGAFAARLVKCAAAAD